MKMNLMNKMVVCLIAQKLPSRPSALDSGLQLEEPLSNVVVCLRSTVICLFDPCESCLYLRGSVHEMLTTGVVSHLVSIFYIDNVLAHCVT